MASYERYFNHLIQKAQTNTAAYTNQRRRKADTDAEEIRREYRAADRAAVEQSRLSLAQTEAEYRKAYDANAVSEAVARRNATEALANSQLTNSGLHAAQQTAVSLVRSRADGELTLRKQAAVENIMRELDTARAQYRRQSAEETAAIYSQAQKDMQDYEAEQTEQAQKQAQAMQDADVKAAKQAADMSLLEMKAALAAKQADQEAKQKEGTGAGKDISKDSSQTNAKNSEENKKDGEDSEAQEEEGQTVSSKEQIDAQAAEKRQNEGNLAAWTYLRKCASEGLITDEERLALMIKNNIREPQTWTRNSLDALVNVMIRKGDYDDARLLVDTVINNEKRCIHGTALEGHGGAGSESVRHGADHGGRRRASLLSARFQLS